MANRWQTPAGWRCAICPNGSRRCASAGRSRLPWWRRPLVAVGACLLLVLVSVIPLAEFSGTLIDCGLAMGVPTATVSEIVPPGLVGLPTQLREMLRVSQQARPEDLATVVEIYREHRIAAEVRSFFTDVPQRLLRAHLAICRAGASTIAELAAIGRPAILIPYPYATDDHQTANARAFAEAGAGWVIPQSELHVDTLALHLENLLGDRAGLATAARCAGDFGRRDATQELARLAVELGLGSAAGPRPQGRAA